MHEEAIKEKIDEAMFVLDTVDLPESEYNDDFILDAINHNIDLAELQGYLLAEAIIVENKINIYYMILQKVKMIDKYFELESLISGE